MCHGRFVSSFESVGAVPQVLGVASLLMAPYVGVVSTLGVLEDGEASSVSLSELPPALWSRQGRIRLPSHMYCGCQKLHMIVPPVPSPVELWDPSAVFLWQGDRLLQLVSSRPGWSRREGWQWRSD